MQSSAENIKTLNMGQPTLETTLIISWDKNPPTTEHTGKSTASEVLHNCNKMISENKLISRLFSSNKS